MSIPTHPRADQGYRYAANDEIIGGRVMNTDVDAIYVRVASNVGLDRTYVIYLTGQDWPVVEYGLAPGVKGDSGS